MSKDKLTAEKKADKATEEYLAPIWKQVDECLHEIYAEKERKRAEKQAEEARAVERVRANQEEADARVEELVAEEEDKKKA